jgi:hypothetical protein
MNNIELLDNPSEEITSEGLDWAPEYRCPNCDSMYDGCYCQNCGYNNND